MTLPDFCRTFGWMMVDNKWVATEVGNTGDNVDRVDEEHYIVTGPAHAKIYTNCNSMVKARGMF